MGEMQVRQVNRYSEWRAGDRKDGIPLRRIAEEPLRAAE